MQRSLLHPGALDASTERPRSALFQKGFRPFFLLAAVFAALVLPWWLLVLGGVVPRGGHFAPMFWHAHEMLFGFTGAVIAGFLLTAVENWTGRPTATGASLGALCVLWCGGRIVMAFPELLSPAATAAVDVAFLAALAVVIARVLVTSGNRRNFVMIGVLAALLGANAMTHLDGLGLAPGWQRRGALVGLDVVVVLMVVLTGRVVPMFTRNATGVKAIRSMPVTDRLAIAATAIVAYADALAYDEVITAAIASAAAVLVLARSAHWGARSALREPLLWILHVGHAWIAVGLALRLPAVLGVVPPSMATHALTVGAVGSLTIGMMARVGLGHTGRRIQSSRALTVAFWMITLSAITRVAAPVVAPGHLFGSFVLSGALWTLSFALYAISHAGVLVAPRVDGKPG